MNADLVFRWNETVSDDDTIYYLGDFSLSRNALTIVKELNGQKILIPGNHDKCFITKGCQNVKPYLDAGFYAVHTMPIEAYGFLMWHLPYQGDHSEYKERYLEYRLKDEGKPLLCGHVHEKWKKMGNQINVGCDVWDYRPVSLERVRSLYEQGV